MIVKIEIDTCDDTDNEDLDLVLTHLSVIKAQIKKNRIAILNRLSDNKLYIFDDNNCYGTHEVKIKNGE